MSDMGREWRIIQIEPLEEPVRQPQPVEKPRPATPVEEPKTIPAGVPE